MRALLVVLLFPLAVLAQSVPVVVREPTMGEKLFDALLPVIVTVVGGALTTLLLALQKKFAADAKGSLIANVGEKVSHFGLVVVQDLENTVKVEMEKAKGENSPGGASITPEEAKQLRDTAIARVLTMLGEKGKDELWRAFGIGGDQVVPYVAGVVETAVANVSRKDTLVAAVAAPAAAPSFPMPLAQTP